MAAHVSVLDRPNRVHYSCRKVQRYPETRDRQSGDEVSPTSSYESLYSYTFPREAEHPSQNDPARHFTVFELDKDEKVVASKHYYV
jgi:hypothetical protein